MRHRVDAIGRHFQIEDRVVAVLLDGLDRVADLREAAAEVLIGEAGEIDVIGEPLARELHPAFEKSRRRTFAD